MHVGSLCNVFWADSGNRHDYKLFGDSFMFDITYETKKYNLVLRLFCNANHHKNTIFFVVGFLFCENATSFEWLFDEFM